MRHKLTEVLNKGFQSREKREKLSEDEYDRLLLLSLLEPLNGFPNALAPLCQNGNDAANQKKRGIQYTERVKILSSTASPSQMLAEKQHAVSLLITSVFTTFFLITYRCSTYFMDSTAKQVIPQRRAHHITVHIQRLWLCTPPTFLSATGNSIPQHICFK